MKKRLLAGLISLVLVLAIALPVTLAENLRTGSTGSQVTQAQTRLAELGGGFVAVKHGRVLAELALPLGGLMTDSSLAATRDALNALDAAARELGCELPSPYMALSFLGLAVVPELRLTDLGLVDVPLGRLVPFAAD